MTAPVALDRRLAVKVAFGLGVLVALVAVVSATLKDPVTRWSADLVAELGISGIFAAVFALDPVPGVGFQPVLFLGYTGGIALFPLVATVWGASMGSTFVVYSAGRRLRTNEPLASRLERYRLAAWLRNHSVTTIAVAAVGPLPYGLATFAAGMVGVRYRHLFAGAAFRGLKIAGSAAAIGLGWG